jgi:hypothetical protein
MCANMGANGCDRDDEPKQHRAARPQLESPTVENEMKRLMVVLFMSALCASAAAMSATPATNAKQQMVEGTTEAATKQDSGARYQGAKPPSEASKLTAQQKKDAMAGVWKMGNSQYGTTAGMAAAKADRNAPKAAKPDFSDPNVREAMRKQKS